MKPNEGPISRLINVRTYAELQPWISGFAEGIFSLVCLIGRPGIGKSRQVRQGLTDRRHGWIDTHATKLACYMKLFWHRDEPMIVDDENSMFTDKPKLTLMNSLCQTDPVKTLRWDSTTRLLEENNVPAKFDTTSPVLVITNELTSRYTAMRALMDRGQVVRFQPPPQEIHEAAANWFTDKEIYRFFGEWLPIIPDLSMRDYVKALGMKKMQLDWRTLLHRQWRNSKLALVVRIETDATLATAAERVQRFIDETRGSRATYFRYVKKARGRGLLPEEDDDCAGYPVPVPA